jgi:hypothetical protein
MIRLSLAAAVVSIGLHSGALAQSGEVYIDPDQGPPEGTVIQEREDGGVYIDPDQGPPLDRIGVLPNASGGRVFIDPDQGPPETTGSIRPRGVRAHQQGCEEAAEQASVDCIPAMPPARVRSGQN